MPRPHRPSRGYSLALAPALTATFPAYTSSTPTVVATTIGPRTTPSTPNTAMPPSTLITTSSPLSEARPPSSTGRRILSTVEPSPAQMPTRTNARTECPVENSQIAAGTQTGQAPTTGRSERNPMTTPQNTGEPRPAIPKAPPQISPCTAAIKI